MAILIKEKQIQNLIRRTIIESIQGIFTDPDFGLELRKEITERLKKYSKNTPGKFVSFSEIKRKYL